MFDIGIQFQWWTVYRWIAVIYTTSALITVIIMNLRGAYGMRWYNRIGVTVCVIAPLWITIMVLVGILV